MIFVVALDDHQRDSLADVLQGAGYSVTPFSEVDLALHAIAQSSPDLVISALSSNLEAWTLCRRLYRSEPPAPAAPPVLVVSSALDLAAAQPITALLGGEGPLPFPVDPGAFLSEVAKLVRQAGSTRRSPAPPARRPRPGSFSQNSNVGYFFIDAQGRFRSVNEAWLRFHGFSDPDEILGRHFSATQTDDAVEQAAKIVHTLLSGELIPPGEFSRKQKDGSTGYHIFSAHPVWDGDAVIGLEGFLVDTTALHAAEHRLQMLFASLLDGCALHEMIFDADGKPVDYRFLDVNPAFERITGLNARDIIGKTVLEVIPNLEPTWIENYGKVAITGQPLRFEGLQFGMGKVFEVVAYRPQPGQFACIFRDITPQIESEKRIRHLVYLNELLRQVNQAIVRSGSENELFAAVCQIAASHGRFRLAWIGVLTPEGVRLAASDDRQAAAFIDVEHCGILRRALDTERPIILNAVTLETSQAACHARASDTGIGSAAAFPIACQGKVCAGLCVHAAEAGFFQHEEVRLLEQVAADVSYALDKLQADRQQRESEERFALAFERFPAAAAIMSVKDGIRLVNRRFEADLGYTRQEAVGKLSWELGLLSLESRNELLALFAREGRLTGADCQLRTKDGRLLDFLLSAESIRIGGEDCLLLIAQEITQRKEAETRLRESEAELAAAQRLAGIGSWHLDLRDSTVRWSDQSYRLVGLSPDEFKPTRGTFLDIVHPDDRAVVYDAIQAAQRGEARYDLEHRLLLPNGAQKTVHAQAEVIRDAAGAPTALRGVVHDITDYRRTQDALQRANEQIRLLADNLHETVLAYDMDRRLIFVNSAFENLTGYSRAELQQQNFICWIAPEDRDRMLEKWESLFRGQSFRDEQYQLITKTGERKWVEASWGPLLDRSGNQCGIEGVERDITDRKRADEEKEHLRLELAQAQKMESVGRLAGGVAHDFNNLLTVINGYSRMALHELKAADPIHSMIDEVSKAGERATELTRQLLAFSRKQVLQPRLLNLNQVVSGVRSMLGRLVGEDIVLSFDLQAANATVFADPHQLEQVLMNLIVNSRDAMPHGGVISLRTADIDLGEPESAPAPAKRSGPYALLSVIDQGAGMDEATLSRIFEPFFTTKEYGKGTGLGLSVVHGIVEQSGGFIEVHSVLGHGTTIQIYLPEAAYRIEPEEPVAISRQTGGDETVLLVEDQPEVRDFAVRALQEFGYTVLQAENAASALAVSSRHSSRIHLIVSDVVMPGSSGPELVEQIRRQRPGIKVLYISGYADAGPITAGLPSPLLPKPFTSDQLAAKVRETLGEPVPAARILVADDEEDVRRLLRMILEREGFRVIEAANGQYALDAILKYPVDLVITDIVMPDREGLETISALRRECPGIGIIAISGAFGGEFLRPAKMLGADAVLGKPFEAETLLARVADVLRLRA